MREFEQLKLQLDYFMERAHKLEKALKEVVIYYDSRNRFAAEDVRHMTDIARAALEEG